MRCRLGWHDLFAIGWGIGRCRRCRVAFHQHEHTKRLDALREGEL